MRLLRALFSLLRGTLDEDAYREYRARLLAYARDVHRLDRAEYDARFAGRYLAGDDRDLFLDYLLAVSKEQPSYVTDHPALLADRTTLFERFGLPILTPHELRDQENARLRRMDSPLRV